MSKKTDKTKFEATGTTLITEPLRPKIKKNSLMNTIDQNPTAQAVRATFIVEETLLEKVKGIAYWDRLQIKVAINDALSSYVAQWEKQHGPVKPVKK